MSAVQDQEAMDLSWEREGRTRPFGRVGEEVIHASFRSRGKPVGVGLGRQRAG